MRKRCFIIAIIAVVCGAVSIFQAMPSKKEIEALESIRKVRLEAYHSAMEEKELARQGLIPDPTPDWTPSYPRINPYAPNRGLLRVGGVAFILALVLFIGGFIIGPPKKAS